MTPAPDPALPLPGVDHRSAMPSPQLREVVERDRDPVMSAHAPGGENRGLWIPDKDKGRNKAREHGARGASSPALKPDQKQKGGSGGGGGGGGKHGGKGHGGRDKSKGGAKDADLKKLKTAKPNTDRAPPSAEEQKQVSPAHGSVCPPSVPSNIHCMQTSLPLRLVPPPPTAVVTWILMSRCGSI